MPRPLHQTLPSCLSLAVLVVGIGLVAGCGGGGSVAAIAPVPVHLATVETGVVAAEVIGIGSVTPVSSIAVKSRVDGQIVAVPVREGADVRVGEPLFRIDPRPFAAQRDIAAANLARDEAMLAKSEDLLKRSVDLIARGYISENQYLDAKADARASAAAVEADKAALANARLNLEFTELRSPIAGRVGKVALQAGNLVKANDVSALLTVLQLDPIYVDFSVPERYLADLRASTQGGDVSVALQVQGSGGAPVARTGSRLILDNQVDQPTGTVRLRALVQNADGALWPGQFARVSVQLPSAGPVIWVPTAAVGQGPEGAYVYVVDGKQMALQRTIGVARVAGDRTVVASGLVAGERIIIDGQSRVLPGQPVVDAAASPTAAH